RSGTRARSGRLLSLARSATSDRRGSHRPTTRTSRPRRRTAMAEKYRKKPVVIEAMRYTGTPDTCVAIHEWCGYQHNPEAGCDSGIYIDTLEGQMRADVGDWI